MADNQGISSNPLDAQSIATFLSQISTFQAQMAKNNVNPMQDPSSPYYIHPSENPGNPLISITLNASNYGSWSRAMLLALKGKNKLKFVDGSLTKPNEDDTLFEAWERCNTYVVSWINLSLSPEISASVVWNNIASDLWKDLKHRYYQGDKYRVAELQEELFSMKQGDLNVTAYYTKLKSIWEDLNNFRPIPNCKGCEFSCLCGLDVIRQYRREDYTTRFLRGLNDQYSTVRSQLMLMNPIPDINSAFSMLTQQERQFSDTHESKVFFNKTNSGLQLSDERNRGRGRGRGRFQAGGRGRGNRIQCTFCDKTGHTVDTCYKKHGLPPHLRQRQVSSINYTAAELPTEKKSDEFSQSNLSNYQKEASDSPKLDLTSHQKEAIIKLLNGQEAHVQPQIANQAQRSANTTSMGQGPSYFEEDWSS
ncbi:uncharacterized protein [Arachis hypogaea]|uniref:uncharacterized protein n=1 Tax=Arachis hypogaea TaxID=3818 RepID=UPI000DED24CE|nr:uncharacterized protein LOC112747297 [Arachis hypogaea]